MDWVENWSVVVVGLVVVFVALILLVFLCEGMGKLFVMLNPKEKEEQVEDIPSSLPVVKSSNTTNQGEIVAAITACIAASMEADGNNTPFTIKSIKRVKGARPVWNSAGIADNTRPF